MQGFRAVQASLHNEDEVRWMSWQAFPMHWMGMDAEYAVVEELLAQAAFVEVGDVGEAVAAGRQALGVVQVQILQHWTLQPFAPISSRNSE